MTVMSKETKKEKDEIIEETTEETAAENIEETAEGETGATAEVEAETEAIRAELDRMKDKMMRHAAEFDNYKKRTAKEREDLYATAVCDTVEKILPVKDNLERAIAAAESADGTDGAETTMADGVKMILKQLDEVLTALGVEEIKAVGEQFDPEKHNAVMHEENDSCGENTITEEFMKGYTCKDKVVRHSMVKVAN